MPRAGVVWDATAKRDDSTWDIARAVESVRFRCPHCAREMPDADTTREHWKKTGHYVAARPDAPAGVKSFRVEALVSRPLAMLAQEFCEAENHATRHGDNGPRVEFRTKREARPWIVEKRAINVFVGGAGYKVADYADGKPIEHEAARFMAIDRQQTHWWVEIGAWSTATGPRYRQLWFGRVETRDQLRDLQGRYRVPDYGVAQDRGFQPAEVDRDCAEFGWRGMRGCGRRSWTSQDPQTGQMVNFPFSDPRVADFQGHEVLFVEFAGDYFKDVLATALEKRGDLKWELPADVNPLYLEQLRGESKREVRPGVWEWREVKSNAPNHGLDTSVAQLCMATIAGVVRFTPSTNTQTS